MHYIVSDGHRHHAAIGLQAEYNKMVIQLAFIVAVLYTAVGLLRLGFLIRFLSHPVITGETVEVLQRCTTTIAQLQSTHRSM